MPGGLGPLWAWYAFHNMNRMHESAGQKEGQHDTQSLRTHFAGERLIKANQES